MRKPYQSAWKIPIKDECAPLFFTKKYKYFNLGLYTVEGSQGTI